MPASADAYANRLSKALILDGLCLHVLSSFQRTGVDSLPANPERPALLGGHNRHEGNLSNVRQPRITCQQLAPIRCRTAASVGKRAVGGQPTQSPERQTY
jgi:hypothetical protein